MYTPVCNYGLYLRGVLYRLEGFQTDRLEIKAGFYISNVSHNKGVYSSSLVKCIKNSMENANTECQGVKGYCCKCGPFRLLRSDLEKKNYFCVVQFINVRKGHKTNYTRKLLTEFQRTSCCISLLQQFRKQIPVHDSTYNTFCKRKSWNGKRSDTFVIGD